VLCYGQICLSISRTGRYERYRTYRGQSFLPLVFADPYISQLPMTLSGFLRLGRRAGSCMRLE
jgi:hypothetical protein